MFGWWFIGWRARSFQDWPTDGVAFLGELPLWLRRKIRAFPSLLSEPSLYLSVIVPAYNEEERMRAGLDEMVRFLRSEPSPAGQPPAAVRPDAGSSSAPWTDNWEIIIVDDGSRDGTADIAMKEYVDTYGCERIRLLKLHHNSGKGAAVRKGMMRARGQYLLMADADGATRFVDLRLMMAQLQSIKSEDGMGFAVGSRAHLSDPAPPSESAPVDGSGADSAPSQPAGSTVRRSGIRRLLMWGFHTFLSMMLGGSPIRDTQCGFKLFTRPAAQRLFSVLHIERWAFDAELVFLAARLKIPMAEVPVTWHEVGGSKVDLISASAGMARDLIVIRMAYALGWWKDAPVTAAADGSGSPTGAGNSGGSVGGVDDAAAADAALGLETLEAEEDKREDEADAADGALRGHHPTAPLADVPAAASGNPSPVAPPRAQVQLQRPAKPGTPELGDHDPTSPHYQHDPYREDRPAPAGGEDGTLQYKGRAKPVPQAVAGARPVGGPPGRQMPRPRAQGSAPPPPPDSAANEAAAAGSGDQAPEG